MMDAPPSPGDMAPDPPVPQQRILARERPSTLFAPPLLGLDLLALQPLAVDRLLVPREVVRSAENDAADRPVRVLVVAFDPAGRDGRVRSARVGRRALLAASLDVGSGSTTPSLVRRGSVPSRLVTASSSGPKRRPRRPVTLVRFALLGGGGEIVPVVVKELFLDALGPASWWRCRQGRLGGWSGKAERSRSSRGGDFLAPFAL